MQTIRALIAAADAEAKEVQPYAARLGCNPMQHGLQPYAARLGCNPMQHGLQPYSV